ncbi:MAG: glycerophosphodiester phosphodiesterase family protein [Bacteroidota bacterium]
MKIIGHRGAAGLAPENTLPSFQAALDAGVTWVELDVYAIDQELVVFHDDMLDRCTNGTGPIQSTPLAHLRTLDAGNGAQIPLLQEVLNLLGPDIGVNVELKGPRTARPAIQQIREYVGKGWPPERFLLSSFDHAQVRLAQQEAPDIPRGVLIGRRPVWSARIAEKYGATSLNLNRRSVHRRVVADAHRKGIEVWVYTVNDPAEAERLRDMDVDAIFTDRPDLMLA